METNVSKIHIGGGTRYNSDSRKGAALVCIYVIYSKKQKEPCRTKRRGFFRLSNNAF